ncbi:MAG: hypothetical protein ACI9VT_001370 [Psychroserpens sp.]|jgi:hypothetical protein
MKYLGLDKLVTWLMIPVIVAGIFMWNSTPSTDAEFKANVAEAKALIAEKSK